MGKRYWCLTQITTKIKTLKSEVIWKSQRVCLVANIQAMERIMQLFRNVLGKFARHRKKGPQYIHHLTILLYAIH